eukprot:TRINITY_DN12333_c0_g1_i3.p1 TRINITY_DN12333_c0_g1~~TRINITY_DN12333_c0_g1_i3.p1  ORF type:complete len:432 (-),score=55.96 TRINITY_DN12333_c0_g1_i3:720-1964(-)
MQRSSLAKRRPLLSIAIPTCPAATAETPVRNSQAEFASAITLGEVLGSGAYAVVRRAWRRGNGGELAVKCVRSNDFEHRRLVRKEFDMLQSMECLAVVSVSALYQCEEWMYLCLEFCNAGDVHSYVEANGPFSKAIAPSLFTQVMRGIRYIHTKRVVHCDIKHENLLLHQGKGGLIIKLADFNSAQRVGLKSSAVPMSCRGTRLFSAPEVIFHGDWNERADIWSCGLCFYFISYGRLPFNVSSPETIKQLLAGKLPCVKWKQTDALTTHLMQNCLKVDAKVRPPALELAQHCLFSDEASEYAGNLLHPLEGNLRGPVALRQQQWVHLPSCGLVRIHTSMGCALCGPRESAGQAPKEFSSVLQKDARPSRQAKFLAYTHCSRDVDRAFRLLGYIKLMRAVSGDGSEAWRTAHTHY